MPVLTFEFCRTEEQRDGHEVASIALFEMDGQQTYVADIVQLWRDLLQG